MSNQDEVQAVVEAVNVLTEKMKNDQEDKPNYIASILVGIPVLAVAFFVFIGK